MAKKVSLLDRWISREKTLVITCHECPLDFSIGQTEQVFIYTCLGGMLRKDDHLQQECICHYLEARGCSQIIVVGHYHCSIMHKILDRTFISSDDTFFQYNLEAVQEEYAKNLLRPSVKNRLLEELNVLEQLKLLMQFDFVKEKISEGLLSVSGVMLEYGTAREIFKNGLSFNNLLALN
jgi:carbonic anhydrase